MRFLFLCFLLVPILEMLVLLKVGAFIGAFYTIVLVLMTAIMGVSLLKQQGLSAFIRANQKMQTGQVPVAEMGEGLMLAVAGALLLTPGFVTDIVGFLLLTPGIRGFLANKWVIMMMKKSQAHNGSASFYTQTTYRSDSNYNTVPKDMRAINESDIVEGEFSEIDENQEK